MIVVLTGFMGCGKTTSGRRLANLLAVPFIDLDEYIIERSGHSIEELFSISEAHFRAIEAEYLKDLLESEQNLVLALGGGAIMNPHSAALIKKLSTCVYLKATTDTLISHLEHSHNRPLLQGGNLRDKIDGLMSLRSATYESCADIIIETDSLDPAGVAIETASRLSPLSHGDL